eukprot:scaffold675_cov103-Cylindrotheca_fusiformis.AAC.23
MANTRGRFIPTINRATIALLIFAIILLVSPTEGFHFKQDTGNCSDITEEKDCIQDKNVFFDCPHTCSTLLQMPGSIGRMEDSAFFDQSVTRQDNGKRLSLEDFEGYVTLYAILPLVPNAQYYYEMLEHVHEIFPYTVEILAMPYQVPSPDEDQDQQQQEDQKAALIDDFIITPHDNPKVRFLQQETRPDLLYYLWESNVYAGEEVMANIPNDRASIYIISADGMFVERLISPSLTDLERRIIVYLKQLEQHREL